MSEKLKISKICWPFDNFSEFIFFLEYCEKLKNIVADCERRTLIKNKYCKNFYNLSTKSASVTLVAKLEGNIKDKYQFSCLWRPSTRFGIYYLLKISDIFQMRALLDARR